MRDFTQISRIHEAEMLAIMKLISERKMESSEGHTELSKMMKYVPMSTAANRTLKGIVTDLSTNPRSAKRVVAKNGLLAQKEIKSVELKFVNIARQRVQVCTK